MRVDGELTRFLAVESGRFVYGGFSLDESRPAVLLGHTLLGDFLSRRELEEALDAVAATADVYDDRIQARFGGRRFVDSEATVPVAQPSPRRAYRTAFGLLGLAAGIAAAVAAYAWVDESWALALFAFLVVSFVVGRGVGDVITDPHKVRRALYFLLQPVVATAILYGTYELWGRWWLAALLGLLGGAIVAGVLAPLLFPRIHAEEQEDTMGRFLEGTGS